MNIFFILQEEETEIEVIEYTTTSTSVKKSEVIESKAPIISGEVVEMGSRVKQSEVRHLDLEYHASPAFASASACLPACMKKKSDT